MTLEAIASLLEEDRGGVWFLPAHVEPKSLQAAAKRAGYAFFHVEGRKIERKEHLLNHVANALHFPDHFGGNWDALEDCLGDLSWRPGSGHVLVFRNWQALTGDDLGVLIDVLRSSAESWSGRGRPFFAVLIDPQARLALPPLHRE